MAKGNIQKDSGASTMTIGFEAKLRLTAEIVHGPHLTILRDTLLSGEFITLINFKLMKGIL